MPELSGREHGSAIDPSERNPFRVLRLIPMDYPRVCGATTLVAKLDLIHHEYKLLLFDCELLCDFEAAEVQLRDERPLLRYHLETDFPGELDLETILEQLNWAACDFFEIRGRDRPADTLLYDFLVGPAWTKWRVSHDQVPTLLAALLDHLLG
jgi:hypothetical protein